MLVFPIKSYLSLCPANIVLHIKQCKVNGTSFSNTSSISDGNSCIKLKSSNWQQIDRWTRSASGFLTRELTDFFQPAWPQVSKTNTLASVDLIVTKGSFLLIFLFNFYMVAKTDRTGFSCNYYVSRITTLKSASEWKGMIQIRKQRATVWILKYRNIT